VLSSRVNDVDNITDDEMQDNNYSINKNSTNGEVHLTLSPTDTKNNKWSK